MIKFTKLFWKSFKDTITFFSESNLKEWIVLVFVGMFSGWNGLQFLLFEEHLYSLLDRHSLMQFIKEIFFVHQIFIPLFLYIIFSLFLFSIIIHSFAESYLYLKIKKIHTKETNKKSLPILGTNLSVSIFFSISLVTFLSVTLFMIIIFIYQVYLSFRPGKIIEISKLLLFLISSTTFITTLLLFFIIDFVLPFMERGKSFNRAFLKALKIVAKKQNEFVLFYAIRFSSVILSIGVYTIIYKRYIANVMNIGVLKLTGMPILSLKTIFSTIFIWENFLILLTLISINIFFGMFIFTTLNIQQKFFIQRMFLSKSGKALKIQSSNADNILQQFGLNNSIKEKK